jgi:hypothetical protein
MGHEPSLQSPGWPSAPLQHGIEQPCAPKAEPDGTAPAVTANASTTARKTLATVSALGVFGRRGRNVVSLQRRPSVGQEVRGL